MIKKLCNKFKNIWCLFKEFGIKYALFEFLLQFIYRNNNNIRKKIIIKRDCSVKKFLFHKYYYVIDKYRNKNIECDKNIEKDAPVFVFWWQGIDNAPDIVKLCINSLKANIEPIRLKIINSENYSDYVNIPDYIIKKLNDGKISLTHFSDLLRVCLLYEYGGIWIDATVFLTKPISKEIYKYKLFTVKHNLYSDFHICKGLWSTSFLASGKNSSVMKFIKDFFFEYWKEENYVITYLLFDCIISLGYENINFIKQEFNNIPTNNINFFEIEKNISKIYDEKVFNIKKSKTYIYKTSYKIPLLSKIDGKDTFYGVLLKKGNVIK